MTTSVFKSSSPNVIKSSQPTLRLDDIQTLDLSADERAVLHVLQAHEGRAHAIGAESLAMATDLHERTVRAIVAHLIQWHHQPIGSATGAPAGYFLITTAEEDERAQAQLRHRIIALAKRLAHLKKNTPHDVLGQLMLEIWSEAP